MLQTATVVYEVSDYGSANPWGPMVSWTAQVGPLVGLRGGVRGLGEAELAVARVVNAVEPLEECKAVYTNVPLSAAVQYYTRASTETY